MAPTERQFGLIGNNFPLEFLSSTRPVKNRIQNELCGRNDLMKRIIHGLHRTEIWGGTTELKYESTYYIHRELRLRAES
jgi:hypothetical protein